MSDGALSQDEIDALLAGVDSSGFGAPAASSSGLPDGERKAVQDFLSTTVQAQSSNLSMMTGAQVSLRSPQVESVNREAFLQRLPDMVTSVKADFTAGFPGEHVFIMGDETAKKIASLMNKEENIELDDMALSVIGEVASQLVGTQITALSDKTGNKGVSSEPPQATNVPKAVVALPAGDFMRATYQLDLGDGTTAPIWEVFGASVVKEMARALGGGKDDAVDMSAFDSPSSMGNMGNMGNMGGFGGSGFGSQQQQQQQQQYSQGGGMQGMMQGMQGMQGMGAFGMGGGSPANVQSIQFPSLIPQGSHSEQGNIGLIMDVFMEMTVELGRTKKLIKEILGMGEGTIIELDKLAGEPVDILVNHKLIAKGEVVVIDENFGVRVTEIVSPMERMSDMG